MAPSSKAGLQLRGVAASGGLFLKQSAAGASEANDRETATETSVLGLLCSALVQTGSLVLGEPGGCGLFLTERRLADDPIAATPLGFANVLYEKVSLKNVAIYPIEDALTFMPKSRTTTTKMQSVTLINDFAGSKYQFPGLLFTAYPLKTLLAGTLNADGSREPLTIYARLTKEGIENMESFIAMYIEEVVKAVQKCADTSPEHIQELAVARGNHDCMAWAQDLAVMKAVKDVWQEKKDVEALVEALEQQAQRDYSTTIIT